MAKKKREKPIKRSTNTVPILRGCLSILAELCGIAGFLLALYIFIKEYL
jgi:hypothetical protein